MGIASWKNKFLQMFNRSADRREATSKPPDIKSFSAQQEKEAAFDIISTNTLIPGYSKIKAPPTNRYNAGDS
ncbi:MAG: hypothetical protein KJN80_04290 [Deltaproteobacteria bacterium]|nr:hypothetical protein [Deltaproteobacteria bacterium]